MKFHIPHVPMGTAIPKLLFQTYPKDRLSAALASNIADLRANNPDWRYRLFDDADIPAFIAEHYGPDVLSLYDRIGDGYGAARADLFRYLLMYKCGGVYLDIKSRFDRPIDDAISGREAFVISQWRNGPDDAHPGWGLHTELQQVPGGEFQQWHIVTVPGHPFLRAVICRVLDGIERYGARRVDVGWKGVLRLTGPIAYTLAIAPLLDRFPHCRIGDETAIGLRYSIYEGASHQALFGKHYTDNLAPVVRQPGWRGFRDRLYLMGRKFRKKWLGVANQASSARTAQSSD